MPKYYETAEHVIAASIALPIVDILAVALKFRVRRIQKQPWKADDWCLVPATVRRFSCLIASSHCLKTATDSLTLPKLLTLAIGVVVSYGAFHRALGWPLQRPPDSQGGSASRATGQEILARKVWSHISGVVDSC